jgi:hypothetical protein
LITGNDDDIKRLKENGDIKRPTQNLFNLIKNTVAGFKTHFLSQVYLKKEVEKNKKIEKRLLEQTKHTTR